MLLDVAIAPGSKPIVAALATRSGARARGKPAGDNVTEEVLVRARGAVERG
jgi:hypothetical protein